MDDQIRDLLRRRADEVVVGPVAPTSLPRRVRRRRIANGVLATVTAVALLTAAYAGAQVAASHRAQGPANSGPVPSARALGRWPGMWPYRTRAAAEAAQASVDQGRDRWRLDARSVVRAYMRHIWQWRTISFDETARLADLDASGPVSINVFDCPSCELSLKDIVTVQRILRPGRTGIWIVIADLHPIPWTRTASGKA